MYLFCMDDCDDYSDCDDAMILMVLLTVMIINDSINVDDCATISSLYCYLF